MRLIVIAIFVQFLFFAPLQCFALDSDKKLHAGFSFAFGATANSFLYNNGKTFKRAERIVWGAGLGTIPGLMKEISDSQETGNKFDEQDMVANIVGATIGSIVSDLTWGLFSVSANDKNISLRFKYSF